MARSKHWLVTAACVCAGTLVVLGCLAAEWARDGEVSPLQAGAAVGALIAALSVVLRRPPVTDVEEEVDQERVSLEELREALERRAELLDGRESELANRVISFQEWLEYPELPDRNDASNSGGLDVATELRTPELHEQDRQVMELLAAESKLVYERIRDGVYRPEGVLDTNRIQKDVLDLIVQTARIYQPDSQNPLLETSVERLLRAGSRTCLHLLIVLERLPLNLHEENFSTLHGYVQKAVKAFDVYSAAEPYLGYASKALYAGRMAAGSNPVTLGITWALTELGKRGAKAIGKKLIDQQVVALLGDLVNVVGFEVAGIYGGDFRHRDPNWIYGSELTDLMSRFPVSRENLARALRDIGGLTLRNEYDRMFLYRCVSAHRSAGPPADSHTLLSVEQRQEISRRLEKFFRDFVHGRTRKRVDEWVEDVQARLGLQLAVKPSEEVHADSPAATREPISALTSLAAFLSGVKGLSAARMSPYLVGLKCTRAAGEEGAALLERLDDLPLQFFEPPDLDPDGATVSDFMSDLSRLCAGAPPLDVQPDDLVIETAAFFGADLKATRRQLDETWSETIKKRLPADAPVTKFDAETARAVLAVLEEDGTARVVFADVQVDWPSGMTVPAGDIWLLGTDSDFVLGVTTSVPWFLKSKAGALAAEKIDGMVYDDCRLRGGSWVLPGLDETISLEVIVPGAAMRRYESRFGSLLKLIRDNQRSNAGD